MTAGDAIPAAAIERLRALGERRSYADGEELVAPGEREYPLALVESGAVEVVRAAAPGRPAEVVHRWEPGEFTGEWGLVTGEAAILSIRAVGEVEVIEIGRARLLEALAADVELSIVVLGELLRRRKTLQANESAVGVQILGSTRSAETHRLRSWAEREGIVFAWIDADSAAGASLALALDVTAEDLPVALTATATLRRATVGELSAELGLSYRSAGGVRDLVVVGAGPAGLAAAVYGASEGLSTLLLDGVATGGQAAASSRIENYLGFPAGISGADLTTRGLIQAQKFGAVVSTPCVVRDLRRDDDGLALTLADGTEIRARTAVIATGATYRRLPLDGWETYEGAGIYFAATGIEAESCAARPVAVVGGANSAGQAALFLAARGSHVDLVVRGDDLAARMSSYLVNRIVDHDAITLRPGSEVTALRGDDCLRSITITDRASGTSVERDCAGLFCFIGARPATAWLSGVALDSSGFVLTDADLDDDALPPVWSGLGRRPFAYETSMPGVFAVGDVRLASMKRVAAAVGEGSSAVLSVHRALAEAPLAHGR